MRSSNLLIVAIILLQSCVVYGDAREEILARIRKEGIPRWEQYEDNIQDIAVTSHCNYYHGKPGEKESSHLSISHIFWNARKHLRMLQSDLEGYKDGIFSRICDNPEYRFEVEFPTTEKKDIGIGPRLTETALYSAGQKGSWSENLSLGEAYAYLTMPITLSGFPMKDLFSDPNFTINTLRYEDKKKNIIFLKASYTGEKGTYRYPNAKYWAKIHIDLGWTVTESGIDTSDFEKTTITETVVYPDFGRFIKNFHMEWKYLQTPLIEGNKVSFDPPKRCSIHDEEFFLPFYGFSEDVLNIHSSKWNSRWLLIINGILCLILAAWFLFKKTNSTSQ